MKRLISGRTAAKMLGVSHTTVARWVRKGSLVPLGLVDSVTTVFEIEQIEQCAMELHCMARRGRPASKVPAAE